MAATPVTVNELVREVGIPKSRLRSRCTDKHLISVSTFLDWRIAAPQLGLKEAEIRAIERKATEEEKRLSVLRKWMAKFSFKATYRRLVKTLLAIGRADHAEEVCRLLADEQRSSNETSSSSNDSSTSLPESSSEDFPTTTATKVSDLPGAPVLPLSKRRKSHRLPKHRVWKKRRVMELQVQKRKLFKRQVLKYHASKRQTLKHQAPRGRERLREKKNELDRHFLGLVRRAARRLKKICVDLDELKVHVTQLPVSIRHQHLKFFSGNLTAINDAKSVVEIFSILGQYWDFLNCGLLQHIIEAFGDKKLKKDMKKYLNQLAHFRSTTTVGEFTQDWTGRSRPFFSGMTMEMVGEWKHQTLEDLEQFRKDWSCQCAFETYLLPLQMGEEGSLILTWGMHCSYPMNDLVLQCQSMTTRHFLHSHGVSKIHFKSMCIFDYKSIKKQLKVERGEKEKQLEVENEALQQQMTELRMQSKQDRQLKEELLAVIKQREAQLKWEQRDKETLEQRYKIHHQQRIKELEEQLAKKEERLKEQEEHHQQRAKELEEQLAKKEERLKEQEEHHQQRAKELEEQLAKKEERLKEQEEHHQQRAKELEEQLAKKEERLKEQEEHHQQRAKELEEQLAKKEERLKEQEEHHQQRAKELEEQPAKKEERLKEQEEHHQQRAKELEEQPAKKEESMKELATKSTFLLWPPSVLPKIPSVAGTGSTMQAQVEMNRNHPAARVCISFIESGRCSYGDRCRYSHVIPPGAGSTMQAQAKKNRVCSLELRIPPKLYDWVIRKESYMYSALRKCREVTGASVRYNKEERKLEISADDNAKCERAKKWIHVNIFIEATEEKWTEFFETTAGPDTQIEFEQVPPNIQKQLTRPVVPKVHQNYFYMKLAGPEDSKAQPGRLKTSICHKEGAGGIEKMKKRMKEVLGLFEQQQQYYIVGIEARFGRIIWDLPEDVVVTHPQWRLRDFQENPVAVHTQFYTEITSNMEVLQRVCSSPTVPPKQFINIALRPDASVPAVKYRMVVEEKTPGHFVLLNLYRPFQKAARIDVVRLGKNHDIRLAIDCSAAMDPDNYHKLFQVAEKVVKTIQRTPDGELQMVAKGDDYTVDFLRDKKQTQYPLRDNPNWVIAKYELKEFCMGDDQSWIVNSPGIVHLQNEKVELELWKEKYFGDRATRDTVTEEYCHNVRTTKWTAEDVVADMEDFIEAAGNIAELLA